ERGEHERAEQAQRDDAEHQGVAVAQRLHRPPPWQRAAGELSVAGLTAPAPGSVTRPSKSHRKKLNQEPYEAVRVSAAYSPGNWCRVRSMTPLFASSMPARSPSAPTSCARS